MKTETTTLRLRIRGIGYREQQLSLSERLDIINKRLNNCDLFHCIRAEDKFPDYPFEKMRTIHHSNIDITKLRRGTRISPDSGLWISKDYGINYLDLEISKLPPKNEDLTEAVFVSLIKERLAGFNTIIPVALDHDQLDISFLTGAVEILSQTALRNKSLENIYSEGHAIPDEFNLPSISESYIERLLEEGWFNDINKMETSSPIQKFWAALSILSPLERDIISSRYKIGIDFETRESLAIKHTVTRERIGQREAKIIRYFRNLNRERDRNLSKSGGNDCNA